MLALDTLRTARNLLRFVEWAPGLTLAGIELRSPAQAAFVLGDLIHLLEFGEAAAGHSSLEDADTVARVVRLGRAHASAATAVLDNLARKGVETAACRTALTLTTSASVPAAALKPFTVRQSYKLERCPIRRFVAPGLQRGKLCGWASAPGVGKSTLALQVGLAVATEHNEVIGGEIAFAGPVIAVMNEDDTDEIGRRVDAILKGFNLTPLDMKHPLHVFGADRPLVLFERAGLREPLRPTTQLKELAEFIRHERPALVILDTLASGVRGADENDAGDMQAVMSALSKLAAETDAAVLVVTHTAKAAAGRSGDQHAVRGSSAITGAMRSVFTLAPLGEDGARSFGLPAADAHRWVRIDAAKANYGPTGQTRWFERELLKLLAVDPRDPTRPAFETVAILRPSLKGPAVALSGLDRRAIVATIGVGLNGYPPLADRRAREGVYSLLHDQHGLEPPAVAVLIDELRHAGVLAIERRKDPRSRHERNVVVVAADAETKLAEMMNFAEGAR